MRVLLLFGFLINAVFSFTSSPTIDNIKFYQNNVNNYSNKIYSNKLFNQRRRTNVIYARFMNNVSRRSLLQTVPLLPLTTIPDIVYASNIDSKKIKNVLVFGASGYTGGDTVRTLLSKNIKVKAFTRRPVKIVNRENADKNTLVIDNLKDKDNVVSIVGDVLKPETLKNIMKDVDAVIYCAASRKIKLKDKEEGKDLVEESSNVEDVGLLNVAKEVIKNDVKKLIIVSSICAKCKKDDPNYISVDDSCEECYRKQIGEEKIKNLYSNLDKLSYTIVRPGLLSPGEMRGIKEIEFNQGLSKSGIISRLDLADVLVNAAESNDSGKKTFEVYYKDTAQPVDMYKSLKTCKEMGKSVKECFFGENYNSNEPLSIDKLMKEPIKGTIFPSGSEISGDNYDNIFKYLKKDEKEYYDYSIIKSNDIS
tara:strand:- start:105 stop:1367 length:1263 start_codon:yes stop_codon:yes gene_type:complete